MSDLSSRTPEMLTFTTSDGVDIVMDVWRSGATLQPVVLCMTPYLRCTFAAFGDTPVTALNEMGITVIVADVRGTGESGGVFTGPMGEREILDGVELIEWLSTNHTPDGKVALVGASYCGANQLMMAARRPKGLVAIAPAVAPVDLFRDWTHWGGMPTHVGWGAVNFLTRKQPAESERSVIDFYYNTLLTTHRDAPLFQERSPLYVLDRIEVPTLVVGGLFDFFSGACYRTFDALRAPKRLSFGPWGHSYSPDPTELLDWFGYWLLGRGEDPTQGDNVHVWRLGANRWSRRQGPGSTTGHALPLGPDPIDLPVVGTSAALPRQTLPPPVPGPTDVLHGWGEALHLEIEAPADLDIEGLPILDLTFDSPDCADVDLFVRLSLVGEPIQQLTEGRLRMSHRKVDEARSRRDPAGLPLSVRLRHEGRMPLSTTASNRALVQMQVASLSITAGSRLRVGLSAVRSDDRQKRTRLILGSASRLILPVQG